MNTPEPRDDETAELLKRALSAEAADVETDPTALQRIQRRTAGEETAVGAPAGERWLLGALGAAVATAAVITAVVVIADNGTTSSNGAPAATQPSVAAETTTRTPAPAPSVKTPGQTYTAVPPPPPLPPLDSTHVSVTYVGRQPQTSAVTSRLYSETHAVDQYGGDPWVAAVHEFLTGQPLDPDYESGWPQGVDVAGISETGGVTTIALEGDADLRTANQPSLCVDDPAAYVQALLRTAGVGGEAAFTYNGQAVPFLFGCVDVAPSVAAQAEDQTRAFISIDNITEGQEVSNPVTVQVSGNVFEGNVNWKLLDANGTKVDEGYVTTSMGTWTQAPIELGTLDPGTYTFKALEYSAENGDPINIDDKTFTVN